MPESWRAFVVKPVRKQIPQRGIATEEPGMGLIEPGLVPRSDGREQRGEQRQNQGGSPRLYSDFRTRRGDRRHDITLLPALAGATGRGSAREILPSGCKEQEYSHEFALARVHEGRKLRRTKGMEMTLTTISIDISPR